ncbi:MAG: aminotransferase class I/II-fold pyridoxal phosphate-dependent enzyme [Deltaproteobacteria bacterium]|nr:aminotransferase class I/II-fold pyridoxal phosphate-dependent enzyme [Deltaproteobacteria bacterium]
MAKDRREPKQPGGGRSGEKSPDGKPGIGTRSVRAGEDSPNPYHSITQPIVQAATYTFRNSAELLDFKEGRIERDEYGRYGNPTVRAVERKLAALDEGEDALLFSSGMSAVTTTLLAFLAPGAHMILTEECYRRTRQFCTTLLSRYGVETSLVAPGDVQRVAALIRPETRLILTESPTNPYLHVIDLDALTGLARERGVKIMIDSTFATPYNQRPLTFGVDLVIHSGTKYLAGHNDVMAGAVVGGASLVSALRDLQGILGCVLDAHAAYLFLRGLKTFELRMARHNENGAAVARFLESHRKVRKVYYPGLEGHPSYKVAREQMSGHGGVVSFEIDGDFEASNAFIDRLRIPRIAPSLGGVESLVENVALMSYYELGPEGWREMGIADSLVRYSAGIEDADDIIADLKQSLDQV